LPADGVGFFTGTGFFTATRSMWPPATSAASCATVNAAWNVLAGLRLTDVVRPDDLVLARDDLEQPAREVRCLVVGRELVIELLELLVAAVAV
jgi:hypothetical protein